VLAYYLSSPQAEIWPNDDGFETLEMRRAIWAREWARREKPLAEEALQARQEAKQVKFVATLTEGQLRWITREVKRRADAKPASNFLQSRYPLYKAAEEQLIQEWRDRARYGECVPVAQEGSAEYGGTVENHGLHGHHRFNGQRLGWRAAASPPGHPSVPGSWREATRDAVKRVRRSPRMMQGFFRGAKR
jgi:hypothetical protein